MVWNLYTMLITTKYRSSVNCWDVTLTVLELCPFSIGKIAWYFVSILLTLVCLNQMLRNLYKMLITTKYKSIMSFGGVALIVLELCTFTHGKNSWKFHLHSITLVSLNQILRKLYTRIITTKYWFWWCYFYCSKVMPLYKWKKLVDFLFRFSFFGLPQPNVMKFLHNTYDHKTQIKYKFG